MAGRILIIDDLPTNRMILRVKLGAARYETFQATAGAEGLMLARQLHPDLILLDVMLPDVSGIDICRALRSDPATAHIPIIIVTSSLDPSERLRAFRAGADEVFLRPFDDLVLLARMRSLLRGSDPVKELGSPAEHLPRLGMAEDDAQFLSPPRVALVHQDPRNTARLAEDLSPYLRAIFTQHSATDALDAWDTRPAPDLILIPATLSAPSDGLMLMSELRSRPATRNSAVCVIAEAGRRDIVVMALDLGAYDVFPDNTPPGEIALRLKAQCRRKQQADRMRTSVEAELRLSMTDPLTGLHNRRYALPHLNRIARDGRPFAVILLDLDHFKGVNDTHGHNAGDAVLVEVAQRLRSRLRAVDLVSRIGGEEFLVALPDCGFDAARATAERLRTAVSEAPIQIASGQRIVVTVSAGLAHCDPAVCTFDAIDQIIDRADRALLAAKSEGRNQVTVYRSAA